MSESLNQQLVQQAKPDMLFIADKPALDDIYGGSYQHRQRVSGSAILCCY
ncbi:hypothetical protein QE250_15410 [Chromatiaceae bacterium AAb-1]|nr:hypothetical protein [Chromatiaceae bacterium AAb-1]